MSRQEPKAGQRLFIIFTASRHGDRILGLAALLILLLRPLIVAFRCGWRNRGDRRGDFLFGFVTALIIFYIHEVVPLGWTGIGVC